MWIAFSMNLDIWESNEIGLKFLGSVFDPFLNSGVSLAILNLSGKVDSFIDKLVISQIVFINTCASSFKT